MTHFAVCSGLTDHAGYTEFRYASAYPTVLRNIPEHELPILIDGGSQIYVRTEEVTRELNIVWK
jgi:hypothetical protein